MNRTDALTKTLKAFETFYTINKSVELPFIAEAEFHSHDSHYVLVRSARIAEVVSNEYAFFSSIEYLTSQTLNDLCNTAWTRGLSRVQLVPYHKNSDILLIVLADKIDEDTFKLIKKTKLYKSYCFSFKGWSNFKLVAMETSSNTVVCNRLGKDLKKTLISICGN